MKKIVSLSLIILLVAGVVGVGYTKDKKYPLRAIIKSDKKVYEVGEPINIEIKLTNIGKKPVTIYKGGDIRLSINFGMKHTMETVTPTPLPNKPKKEDFVKLKPGESCVVARFNMVEVESILAPGIPMYYKDMRGAKGKRIESPLCQPGQYKIDASYHILGNFRRYRCKDPKLTVWYGSSDERVITNTITITVKPAKN